jgi:hypothetical protein
MSEIPGGTRTLEKTSPAATTARRKIVQELFSGKNAQKWPYFEGEKKVRSCHI